MVSPRFDPRPQPTLNRAKALCLSCRSCFKRDRSNEGYVCPSCGEEAVDIGSAFKAPRRDAQKQWALVLFLARNGYRYRKLGGPAPKNMAEARRRLALSGRPIIE